MCNHTGAYIEFNITDKAQSYTVSTINDFFFAKLTNAHIITHILSWFIICEGIEKVALRREIPEDDNSDNMWYNQRD